MAGRDLARVDVREAAFVGVTGGVIAIAIDVACLLAIGKEPPAGWQ